MPEMGDKCRKQASLTMSARVKHFSSALQHALKEERHFALIDGVAFPTVGSLVIVFRSGTQSDQCISSVTPAMMITTLNSPQRRARPRIAMLIGTRRQRLNVGDQLPSLFL
jgi:hypothetical protein